MAKTILFLLWSCIHGSTLQETCTLYRCFTRYSECLEYQVMASILPRMWHDFDWKIRYLRVSSVAQQPHIYLNFSEHLFNNNGKVVDMFVLGLWMIWVKWFGWDKPLKFRFWRTSHTLSIKWMPQKRSN